MDPSISGCGAEPIFRDNKVLRITKKEHLKSKQKVLKRDDPELDKLPNKVIWSDPMEHLGKKKYPEPVLPNLGESDMKYIVPQGISDHSWFKKGIEAPPNRYGIKPGRHWDGVNRSNGFEERLLKTANDSPAKEKGLSCGEEP